MSRLGGDWVRLWNKRDSAPQDGVGNPTRCYSIIMIEFTLPADWLIPFLSHPLSHPLSLPLSFPLSLPLFLIYVVTYLFNTTSRIKRSSQDILIKAS